MSMREWEEIQEVLWTMKKWFFNERPFKNKTHPPPSPERGRRRVHFVKKLKGDDGS